jgi:hypothetical protein
MEGTAESMNKTVLSFFVESRFSDSVPSMNFEKNSIQIAVSHELAFSNRSSDERVS